MDICLLICAIGTVIDHVVRQGCGTGLCDGVRRYWCAVIVLLGRYRWGIFCDYELEVTQNVHNLLMREGVSTAARRTGENGGKKKMKILNFPVRNCL